MSSSSESTGVLALGDSTGEFLGVPEGEAAGEFEGEFEGETTGEWKGVGGREASCCSS
jgi:hypothetical protein